MFTQGLDPNALKWVRENQGSQNLKKEMPNSSSNIRNRFDPYSSIGGSRGFGLPPPSKFCSSNLSGVIPPRGDVDDSGPDDDLTSESEEGHYSLDSSPQDDRIPAVGSGLRHQPRYASDSMYSGDVSSSRETLGTVGRGESFVRGPSRYTVDREDESSADSVSSSEFSRVESVSGGGARTRTYVSEGYASSIPSRANGSVKDFKDDLASAPPIFGGGEIKHQPEQSPSPSITEHAPPQVRRLNDDILKTDYPVRNAGESGPPSNGAPARLPTFHASAQGPWYAVIAYDACVRLCLHAWAKQCMEAPKFLENECALLREAFGLQNVLLQSEEELLGKRSSEMAAEGAAPKPKKMVGKMKVQVRKVRMVVDPPPGCNLSTIKVPKIKMDAVLHQFYKVQLRFASGWRAIRRIHFSPQVPPNRSLSRQSLAYVQASAQYVKQVSGLLKVGVKTLRSNSSGYEAVQAETYTCFLRLKSASEEDAVRMQPGTGETHLFLPDSLGDDLIIEVQDAKGKVYGRVLAQVAAIADDPGEKLRWWCIYREPEHELVGRIQLFINYSTSLDENNHLKCGSVAETVAYDLALEVAMKVQHFQQRNLLLHGPWKWLLTEFASYYGVSDDYTRLRYLSYVMDVATPTADCLKLVYDLLYPVAMKGLTKNTLSHQENRILGDVVDQINQILALVFENYKSLDESAPSGLVEVFRPATGFAAPALEYAMKLYSLLHDIFSPEAQTKLYGYFQAAAKKRSKRHLTETDEFVTSNEGLLMDSITMSTAYQKMKSLCLNIRNEIFTDIEIHKQDILPSFIDLPNLSSAIYSVELCTRLRAFLITCPPAGPSPPVADLVIATADLQRDLASWNIKAVKGGVDAKELFHLYIMLWIQDKRMALLETCKLDKVKWSGVRTPHSTTPFVDEMYERLRETLNDYGVIICRWPEYTFTLESAIADVEKAIIEALDKQYADVLHPLKENMAPKMFGLKYVQKLTKRSVCPYLVPDELGILLNSMKRMLDTLRPKIDQQLKSWGLCIPDAGNTAPGDRLSEVTVMLRTKFRTYMQAVVEKLAENSRLQNLTKLKKILQDSKENVVESDIRSRMQPLKEQLTSTINHLHSIFGTQVFISICRGYWDRMGQDVLSFLENRKENRSWYKGSRIAVSILDDTFASQMQQLLGNALQEKDLDPPKTITEVRSMLCRDAPNHKGNTYYY